MAGSGGVVDEIFKEYSTAVEGAVADVKHLNAFNTEGDVERGRDGAPECCTEACIKRHQ